MKHKKDSNLEHTSILFVIMHTALSLTPFISKRYVITYTNL